MLKIGILGADGGTESGHALGICNILNSGKYDVELIGLYGDNAEEAKALANMQGIPYIAEKPEDFLGKADAVFVLQRNGSRHLSCAMPYLEAGIPVFVDKPFACTTEDAERMVAIAKKSGSVLCGGSCVKFSKEIAELKETVQHSAPITSAYFSFPLYLDSPHGGLHFYSHHLICEMLTVCGYDVESLTAVRVGNHVTATANYHNFPVLMNYAANYNGLHATVYFADGTAMMKNVDLAGTDEMQCRSFLEAVKTGIGDDSEELLFSTVLSNALQRSLESGKEIIIGEVKR